MKLSFIALSIITAIFLSGCYTMTVNEDDLGNDVSVVYATDYFYYATYNPHWMNQINMMDYPSMHRYYTITNRPHAPIRIHPLPPKHRGPGEIIPPYKNPIIPKPPIVRGPTTRRPTSFSVPRPQPASPPDRRQPNVSSPTNSPQTSSPAPTSTRRESVPQVQPERKSGNTRR